MFADSKKLKHINILCTVSFILTLYTVLIINKNLYDQTLTGKYFWFYITMGFVCFSTFVSYLFCQKKINFSFIDLVVSVLFVYGFSISYYFNGNVSTKLALFTLLFCLYFFLRIFLFQDKGNNKLIVVAFILLGFIEATWGLCQLYGYTQSYNSGFKITGSLYNPGPFSGYLAMILPAAVYFLVKDRAIIKQSFGKENSLIYLRWIISALTFSAIILILPAAMSRASWVAALGGCSIVLLLTLVRENNKYIETTRMYLKCHRTKCILYLSGFLIIACFMVAGIYHLKKDSADGRFFMWKIATQTMLSHPQGVGIGNFSGSYGTQQIAYFESGKGTEREMYVSGCPEYAFNEYFQIGVELGIAGLVLFLIIMGLALYTGIKNGKIMATGSLISLLLFACMSYPFNLLPFLIALVFMLVMCVSSEGQGETICRRKETGLTYCVFITYTIITIWCLVNRYPTYQAYKDWKTTSSLFNSGMYKNASEKYAQLEPYLFDQVGFLLEYSGCLASLEEYDKSNLQLQKASRMSCNPIIFIRIGKNYQTMKQYAKAEQYYLYAANTIPSRLYPLYVLVKLYLESGQKEKALFTAKALLEKEPKVDSPAIREMKAEMKTVLSGKQHKERDIPNDNTNL